MVIVTQADPEAEVALDQIHEVEVDHEAAEDHEAAPTHEVAPEVDKKNHKKISTFFNPQGTIVFNQLMLLLRFNPRGKPKRSLG